LGLCDADKQQGAGSKADGSKRGVIEHLLLLRG
jgi:hypothetical protein